MNINEIPKYSDVIQRHMYSCSKCGNREFIPHRLNKTICRSCGYWVYKSLKDEFKEKICREIKNYGNKF